MAGCCRSRMDRSRASSLFRDHNSRSTMTGSRWGWPAPAARPSSSTINSFQTIAPSAFNEMLTGNGPGTQTNTNPLYRQPMLAVVPHCLVAPALGMARGALEAFNEQAAGRTTRGAVAGGNNKMSEFTTIQMRVAEATASIDAAQLMIHRDISDTLSTVTAGKPADVALRMRNRLTHSFRHQTPGPGGRRCFPRGGRLGARPATSGAAILARHPCR